jgi:hypothetical protein
MRWADVSIQQVVTLADWQWISARDWGKMGAAILEKRRALPACNQKGSNMVQRFPRRAHLIVPV